MPTVRSILRASLLASFVGVLAACGTTAPEKEELPESAYLLEANGRLADSEFDPGAELFAVVMEEVISERSASFRPYDTSFAVAENGDYQVQLDARKFPGEPIAIEDFVRWQLIPSDDDVVELSISNTDTGLRILDTLRLEQLDAGGKFNQSSHWLTYNYTIQSNGRNLNLFATAVFSPTLVTVEGSVASPGAEPYVLTDMTLEPGWNLVFYEPADSGPYTLSSAPLESQELEASLRTTQLAWRTDSPQGLAGYSIFAAHEVSAGTAVDTFRAVLTPSSSRSVSAYSWIKDAFGGYGLLVPLNQALPGSYVSGAITVGTAGVESAFAEPRYYDETAIELTEWWKNPSLATGEMAMVSDDGNELMALYVDRSTTLDLASYVVDVNGETRTYNAASLDLWFGWNLLEAIEDTTTMTTELVVLDSSATWDIVPFATP